MEGEGDGGVTTDQGLPFSLLLNSSVLTLHTLFTILCAGHEGHGYKSGYLWYDEIGLNDTDLYSVPARVYRATPRRCHNSTIMSHSSAPQPRRILAPMTLIIHVHSLALLPHLFLRLHSSASPTKPL